MRRRALIQAIGGTLTAGAAGRTVHAAASTPAPAFGPLGSVTIPGGKEAVVGPAGRYVYVATTDGFAIVDVADPTAPSIVTERREIAAELDGGPLATIFDLQLDPIEELLVVVGPAQGAAQLRGFATFDVSEPTDPTRLTVTETPFYNHNCDVDAGVVYLCGNDGRRNAVVAHDAVTGERLGDWSILSVDERWSELPTALWPLHDVHVSAGVAYLAQWDAGTWMVDVSEPAAPTLIGRLRGRSPDEFLALANDERRRELFEIPGNDHYAAPSPSGSLVGVGVEASDYGDDGTGGPGGIHLYDVSTPQSPVERAVIAPPPSDDPGARPGSGSTTAHNFELREQRAYTAWYAGGVRLYDISSPETPELLAAWRDPTASFWTAQAATETYFIGMSHLDPTLNASAEGARLYTFPTVPTTTATSGGLPADSPATASATRSGDGWLARPGSSAVQASLLGVAGAGLGLGAWAWRRHQDRR